MFLEPPVSPAPAVALVRAAARPALIGVAPRPAPSDTADARYARATFSPGHGPDGRLSIRLAARPGTRSIVIPRVPEGGLWLLRVDDGAGAVRFVPLIVRDPRWSLRRPPAGTPLVVFPLVTWRAYNGADTNRDGRADSWYAHPD